jgi:hypothetical protein
MARPATKEQLVILQKIKDAGGEALRQEAYYVGGGWTICHRSTMDLMARKGLVKIETVGQSAFAVPVPSVSL